MPFKIEVVRHNHTAHTANISMTQSSFPLINSGNGALQEP